MSRLTTRIVFALGLAYVSVWWSYERFYGQFGVAPQDVGLAPSAGFGDAIGAILRLGVWLSAALLVLALVPGVSLTAVGFILESHDRPRQWGVSLVGGVVCLAGTAAAWAVWLHTSPLVVTIVLGAALVSLVLVWGSIRDRSSWANHRRFWIASTTAFVGGGTTAVAYVWLTSSYVTVAIAVGTVGAVVWKHTASAETGRARQEPAHMATADEHVVTVPDAMRQHEPRFAEWLPRRITWSLRAFDVFTVVAIVGLLFLDLPGDAAEAGSCVRTGNDRSVRGIGAPFSYVHLTLLDVYAQPAKITWNAPPPPVEMPAGSIDATYLGTANGWVVAYEHAPPELLRLPAGSVTVEVHPTAHTCSAAH
jgi:hypothetical protein